MKRIKSISKWLLAAVMRCFWRILGRKYFILIDESYYQDYYFEIEGYKTKDGHIHITKEYYYRSHNIT